MSIKAVIISLVLVLLTACGGSDSDFNTEDESNLSTASGSILGQVFDARSGSVLQEVNIRVSEKTTISGADGRFSLLDIDVNERVVVTFSVDGYAEQSKIIRVQEGGTSAMLPSVLMLPVEKTMTFDPMIPQEIFVEGSFAGVTLEANSLIRVDGLSPSGEVVVEITPIDPTVNIDLMPGDMKTDTGAGVLAPIESYGTLNIVFRDSLGNDLNLSEGSVATVRIPVANKTGGTPPSRIPLYFYNDKTGLWVEEGFANIDETNRYYEGSVTHFSTWNADVLYEQVLVSGCIKGVDGAFLSNVYVALEGDNYSGIDFAYTDENGYFSGAAKTNASVLVTALHGGVKTNTVKLMTESSDIVLDTCLVLSTENILEEVGGASSENSILEGGWIKSCGLGPDLFSGHYDVIHATFTKNTFSSTIFNYSDAACTTPLPIYPIVTTSGTFFIGEDVMTREGVLATKVDYRVTEFSVDTSILDGVNGFDIFYMPPESNLYFGESSNTVSERPTSLRLDRLFIKQ